MDAEPEPEIAATIGASIALGISDIPFNGPIAAARVGTVDGRLICSPSIKQLKESNLDLLVAGSEGSIIMVEAGSHFVSEEYLLDALRLAEESMKGVIGLQKRIISEVGLQKMELTPHKIDEALEERVAELACDRLNAALRMAVKQERYAAIGDLQREAVQT